MVYEQTVGESVDNRVEIVSTDDKTGRVRLRRLGHDFEYSVSKRDFISAL